MMQRLINVCMKHIVNYIWPSFTIYYLTLDYLEMSHHMIVQLPHDI